MNFASLTLVYLMFTRRCHPSVPVSQTGTENSKPERHSQLNLSESSSTRFKIDLFHRPSRQLGCRGYKTPTCLLGPRCSQLVPSWLVGPYGGWQRLDCSHTRWFNLITVLPPLRVFGLWTGPTLMRGGNTVLWHWVWLLPCAEWTISM